MIQRFGTRFSSSGLCVTILIVLQTPFAPAEVVSRHNQSWLEKVDGLEVLHLKGTPSEMGYDQGFLLADRVKKVYQGLGTLLTREATRQEQTEAAAAARPYVPESFVQEITAIATATNDVLGPNTVDPNRLLELHSWIEILREGERGATAHFAALGAATVDGHVIVGANRDDEQAVRRGLQDGAIVVIREPSGGRMFCTVTWAGFAGVFVGMNDQGLAISESCFPAFGQSLEGMPVCLQLRSVLEQATDIASAENLLKSMRRTVSGNVLLADGKSGGAVKAIEFTSNRLETFTQGDAREDHTYVIRDSGVPVTIKYFDPAVDLVLPAGHGDITANISQSVPNAIVRSSFFLHHDGEPGSATPPLLELQTNWVMNLGVTNPEFDFIDVTKSLPAAYPYRSLDMMYLIDKIVSKQARDVIPALLAGGLDFLVPDWESELYKPMFAAVTRYWKLRDRVAGASGAIDTAKAIELIGGGQTDQAFNPLTEPNSIQSVVMDATTLELWIATASPKSAKGKPDANLQTYRHLSLPVYATYPMTVTTDPVAGEVTVDGTSLGNAPQTTRVSRGQHTVSFGTVDGYVTPADQTVTVGFDGASVTGKYVPIRKLTVHVAGNGTVDPNGGLYPEGTEITLRATPVTGAYFNRWTGDVSAKTPDITFTITKDTDVTADFSQSPPGTYSLTVFKEGQGTVIPDGDFYAIGSTVLMTATPSEGWYFVEWKGDVPSTERTIRVVMEANRSVTAVFQQKLTLTVETEGRGQLGIDPPDGNYAPNTTVTLWAEGRELPVRWRFVEWKGDIQSTDNPLTITMDSAKHLVAVFSDHPAGDDPNDPTFPPCAVPAASLVGLLWVGGWSLTSRRRRASHIPGRRR